MGRDCLETGAAQVIEQGLATEEEIQQWREEAAEEVQAAVAQAQTEPRPDPYRDDWRAYSSKGMQG